VVRVNPSRRSGRRRTNITYTTRRRKRRRGSSSRRRRDSFKTLWIRRQPRFALSISSSL